jgi:hypothetical protein
MRRPPIAIWRLIELLCFHGSFHGSFDMRLMEKLFGDRIIYTCEKSTLYKLGWCHSNRQ